jgi:hypothetical protein
MQAVAVVHAPSYGVSQHRTEHATDHHANRDPRLATWPPMTAPVRHQ